MPAIAILVAAFVASGTFFLKSSLYFGLGGLIFVFCLPASIALACYFVGIVCGIYDHELSALFFKSFIAQSTFVFFFIDALFSLAFLVTHNFLLEPFLLPLLFLANAIILYRFGDILIGGKRNQAVGLCAKRLATSLGVCFFASFIALSPIGIWIGDPLYYAALTYAILSVSPLIAFSKRTQGYHEAGLYLMRSALLWSGVAFFIGVAALALTVLQNNVIAYAVITALGAIVIATVGFRIYSLGSERIAKQSEDVYEKHIHKLVVVPDESFDFLRNNMDEFIRSGRKENLLIALTTLLTNAGYTFEESEPLLRNIADYEVPAIHKIPYLSMRKSLELEVEKRAKLINETFNHMAHDTSVVKTI